MKDCGVCLSVLFDVPCRLKCLLVNICIELMSLIIELQSSRECADDVMIDI